jgi:hypothetical protein
MNGRQTPLQLWLDENDFTSAQLEEETGIGRQSMTRIRAGGDVRRKTMMRILRGARKLKGAKVTMDELFDCDPDSPYNQL